MSTARGDAIREAVLLLQRAEVLLKQTTSASPVSTK